MDNPSVWHGLAPRSRAALVAANVLACLWLPFAASAQPAPTATNPAQPAPTPTAPQATTPTLPQRVEAWRATMAHTPLPGKGCFSASFPNTQWQGAKCTAPPQRPYRPARGARPETVGNGNDFVAVEQGGLIDYGAGYLFPNGVTSESDNLFGANSFSLQLNTNTFNTPACNNAGNPSQCQGWEQFVYSNSGVAFIQYWLLNYNNSCPPGWNTYSNDCWANSQNAVSIPVQAIANLGQIQVGGEISAGQDIVAFVVGSAYYQATSNDPLTLEQGWQQAEYGIFGDGDGSQAVFNDGATIEVLIQLGNGTNNNPNPLYATTGFTGETNNLNLLAPPCLASYASSPALLFSESNASGATSPCAAAAAEHKVASDPVRR
jgi:hypothetical protein